MGSVKKEKNSTNPFERLPEDVVILIMKELPNDLRFLRQCSLVSKQFASAILHVPKVKLALPMSQFVSRYAKTTNLLSKFSNLSSLHLVVFTDDTKHLGRHFWHMKVKAETEFYTVAFIHSLSIRKMDGASNPALMDRESCRFSMFVKPILWHDLLAKIIQDNPMLHSVQISSPDSSNQVFLSGEELIKLKNLRMQTGSKENGPLAIYYSSLILPVSGYVMEDVCVDLQRIGGEDMLDNVDDIIDWDYGEDEKVFGEALKLVLMKYKN